MLDGARVVKLVDTADLKSADPKRSYRFDSGSGHHGFQPLGFIKIFFVQFQAD